MNYIESYMDVKIAAHKIRKYNAGFLYWEYEYNYQRQCSDGWYEREDESWYSAKKENWKNGFGFLVVNDVVRRWMDLFHIDITTGRRILKRCNGLFWDYLPSKYREHSKVFFYPIERIAKNLGLEGPGEVSVIPMSDLFLGGAGIYKHHMEKLERGTNHPHSRREIEEATLISPAMQQFYEKALSVRRIRPGDMQSYEILRLFDSFYQAKTWFDYKKFEHGLYSIRKVHLYSFTGEVFSGYAAAKALPNTSPNARLILNEGYLGYMGISDGCVVYGNTETIESNIDDNGCFDMDREMEIFLGSEKEGHLFVPIVSIYYGELNIKAMVISYKRSRYLALSEASKDSASWISLEEDLMQLLGNLEVSQAEIESAENHYLEMFYQQEPHVEESSPDALLDEAIAYYGSLDAVLRIYNTSRDGMKVPLVGVDRNGQYRLRKRYRRNKPPINEPPTKAELRRMKYARRRLLPTKHIAAYAGGRLKENASSLLTTPPYDFY